MNTQLKMSYLQHKRMKKLYGKMIGRDIAFGRKMVKAMQSIYTRKPEIISTL